MSVDCDHARAVRWDEVMAEFRHELANVLTVGLAPGERQALVERCRGIWGADPDGFFHRELESLATQEDARPPDCGIFDVVLIRAEPAALERLARGLMQKTVRLLCLEVPDDTERDAVTRLSQEISHLAKPLWLSTRQLLLTREAVDGDRILARLRNEAASPALAHRICILTQQRSPRTTLRRRVRFALRRAAHHAWPPLGREAELRARRGTHGPASRLESLRQGLEQLGQAYDWNPPLGDEGPFVHAVCHPGVLRQAIEQKRLGKIQKLMAGPNISALPHDDDAVSVAPEVDRILFASPWIQRWFESLDASVADRAAIWPAGVDLRAWHPRPDRRARVDFLVFEKLDIWTAPIAEEHHDLSERVQRLLAKRGYSFEVLRYGDFLQGEYAEALGRCRAMIYLSLQETQSIAIAEAWAAGLPVLAWSCGRAVWHGQHFDGASSCPYGDDTARAVFRSYAEFGPALADFQARLDAGTFQPRAYVARELSVQATTRRYLDVWRKLLAGS